MDFSGAIKTQKRFLEDRIEPDFGLVDQLYSCEIIDDRESSTILGKSTFWERNSQVLDYILTKNQGGGLITALRDTNQRHVANFITANGERSGEFGEDWPLETAQISILKFNHKSLVELLNLTDLLGLLYSSDVINNRQKDTISSKSTLCEKSKALLDILRKRSLRDYQQTITCLRLSQQNHIAEILENGGVVVRVHANLDEDVDNVTNIEIEIVTKIESHREQIKILELELAHHRVIAAKTGQSIVLYIYCKTTDEIEKLQESLASGKLKDSVDLWFNSLLNRLQTISVKAVTVSAEELKTMRTYFKESSWIKSEEQRRVAERWKRGTSTTRSSVADFTETNLKTSASTHKRFLEDRIDPDFGLLETLYSCAIIDRREKATILSKSTFLERNSQVLYYILKKDQSGGLITALGDADQKHIANFIAANGERSVEFGEDWPLEPAEISILESNHESLVDLLDLTDLLGLLYSTKVINKRQRDSISSKLSSHEKNEALLEILRKRSIRDYRQTIICLRQTRQNHIAKILHEGGVVVRAHADLDEDVKNVTAIENEIVTTIADMLIDRSIDQKSRILGLIPKVRGNLGEDVKNVTAIENEIVKTIQDLLIGTTSDQQIRTLELLHHRVIAAKK